MNKNEMILEIMNVYDENQKLKTENELLRNSIGCKAEAKGNGRLTKVELILIEEGKKTLLRGNVSNYINLDEEEDDKGNKIIKTTFEQWAKRAIYKDNIPSSLSLDEFISATYDELKVMYDQRVKNALRDE